MKKILNILLNSKIATIFLRRVVDRTFSFRRFRPFNAVRFSIVVWAPSATKIDALLFWIFIPIWGQAVYFELAWTVTRSALILKISVDASRLIFFRAPMAASSHTRGANSQCEFRFLRKKAKAKRRRFASLRRKYMDLRFAFASLFGRLKAKKSEKIHRIFAIIFTIF